MTNTHTQTLASQLRPLNIPTYDMASELASLLQCKYLLSVQSHVSLYPLPFNTHLAYSYMQLVQWVTVSEPKYTHTHVKHVIQSTCRCSINCMSTHLCLSRYALVHAACVHGWDDKDCTKSPLCTVRPSGKEAQQVCQLLPVTEQPVTKVWAQVALLSIALQHRTTAMFYPAAFFQTKSGRPFPPLSVPVFSIVNVGSWSNFGVRKLETRHLNNLKVNLNK